MGKVKLFLSGVKKEVGRVRWPSKENMLKFSIATVISIVFFALFFYVIDIVIALIKTWLN
ncbi:MAG: preprotein translocase subunit SecE [Bacilli bacterium]